MRQHVCETEFKHDFYNYKVIRELREKYGLHPYDGVYAELLSVIKILHMYSGNDYNELKEYEKHLMIVYLNTNKGC